MNIHLRMNKEQILEALAEYIVINIPDHIKGEIKLIYNEDDGVDIYIMREKKLLN